MYARETVSRISLRAAVVGQGKVGMDDIPTFVREMRECYNSGVNKQIQTRIKQLKQLRKFFTENEQAIIEVSGVCMYACCLLASPWLAGTES